MKLFDKPLVVVTEDSDPRPAVDRALALVPGGRITLLDIAAPVPVEMRSLLSGSLVETMTAARDARRNAVLDELGAAAAAAGVAVDRHLAEGAVYRVAIEAVLSDGFDVLLKTADGLGQHSRATRSGTDKHLLRKCPCPVWLGGAGERRDGRILAAVNPDPAEPEDAALARRIVEMAAALAALDGAELHVLHAWRAFGEFMLHGPEPVASDPEVDHILGRALNHHGQLLDALVDEADMAGVTPQTHLVHARPADAIIQLQSTLDFDLLVMGTVGRTGVPGLMIGNTAERVLDEIDCPVLALKPDGFVSPVETST